jgi:hypothetical protein
LELGLTLQLTIPYSPSQNGKAEVLNRHLTDMMRTLLKTANLPNGFWAEAFMHAIFIKNRSIRVGKNVTPIEECFKWHLCTVQCTTFYILSTASTVDEHGHVDDEDDLQELIDANDDQNSCCMLYVVQSTQYGTLQYPTP